jgi:hypothetical protein
MPKIPGKTESDGILVMKERCDECLFSPDRIVSNERAAEVLADCAENGTHFICHKATLKGRHVCCRGFYDKDPMASNALRVGKILNAIIFLEESEL